jgi:hypothetical protein
MTLIGACAEDTSRAAYPLGMTDGPPIDEPSPVTGSARLAVAVQRLDHLDGLEVAYRGYLLADGSIAAWAEHEGVILAVTVMPDGGGILMGTYPDLDAAIRRTQRARAWRGWPQEG